MKFHILLIALIILQASSSQARTPCTRGRGMWVWTAFKIITSTTEQQLLVTESMAANVTDLFLYLLPKHYTGQQAGLQAFVKRLSSAGLRAWGLDGYRGYFSDAYGPAGFYASVDAMLAYNAKVAAGERFVGFTADNEPHDQSGFKTTFHNGLKDSALSTTTGGVWYGSQAQDRDRLMQDWLATYTSAAQRLQAAGLQFSSAINSFIDDYYGEPLRVSFNGSKVLVMHRMMATLDQHLIMSYSTSNTNVYNRVSGEFAYASSLPADVRPHVFAAIEVHKGAGCGVSYGDTAGKASRAVVLSDLATMTTYLSSLYPSFCGINIHDWEGWKVLPK